MAIAFVQGSNSTNSATVSLTGVASGNLLVFTSAVVGTVNPTVVSVVDTQLNTYTHIPAADGSGVAHSETEIWYAKNVTGGSVTVTVVFSQVIAGGDIFLSEFSGAHLTSPLESGANVTSPSVGHASGPTLTPLVSTDMLISVIVPLSGSGSGAFVNAPWTKTATPGSDDPCGYLIPASTSAQTMQTPTAGNQNYCSSGAIFIAAATGPTPAVQSGAFLTY